ncbi:MAG: hypothetical protein U0835_10855 [Isosphaeraceae bacterium]
MRHQRPSRARRKPCAERLEGRRLLSVFTVTNTDDSGDGSLRDAIERANARPGPDSIAFDLPGSGLRSITPGSALPTITDTLTIDGYTQDGASPNTQVNSDDAVILVALDGLKAGGGASGLTISANGCAVRGLAIRRFPGAGILVDDADGCVFQGNFIGGTTTADVDVLGNKLSGISLLNAADTLVGGDRPADRNVLDDNDLAGVAMSGAGSVRNTVAGNFLGLDVRGTGPVGNSFGVLINGGASFNTVGGVTPGARNVIADNGSGVTISFRDTTHNRVVGNFIGTDALGANSLQNTTGVFISDGSSDNVVGGPTAAERNVISGNFVGVLIKEVGGEANQAGGNFTTDNSVLGNYIGTDPAGLNPVRNIQYGVLLIGVHGTKIGGARPGMGNVISASVGGGVEIIGQTATGNLIQGNLIGTDATGLANADTLFAQATGTPGPLGNLGGGVIVNNAPGNLIGGTEPGAGNVISGNGLAGVQLFGPWATGNVIQGNKIGVDATGLAPLGNTPDGVQVNNAPGNLIGGTEPGARNVISANASEGVNVVGPGSQQNHIQGNTIGADLTGTNPLPNTLDGVFLNNAPGNVVGGNTPGARNVISGNGQTGVRVFNRLASDNQILGNFIGTDPTGAKPLPNGRAGVQIEAAGSNVIGGDGTGQGNLVSGNPVGVMLLGPAASGNLIVGNTVGTDATGTKPLGNGTGVMISGAAGNVVRADLVSGNQVGIQIAGQGASGNIVQGCTVGTDRAGALSVANGVGVLVSGASGNLIGGTSAGQGNLISGNTSAGFHVFDRFASGNVIAGNVVGLDRAGLRAVVGKNGRQQVGVLINQAPGNDLNERPGAGTCGRDDPGARISSRVPPRA